MSGLTDLVEKAQDLSDVELAMLLSLMASEHCMVQTEDSHVEALEHEIRLVLSLLSMHPASTANPPPYKIASATFNLSSTTLHCSPSTTTDSFSQGILIPIQQAAFHNPSSPDPYSPSAGKYTLPNIIVLTRLSSSPRTIAIMALELLRTGCIFTHREMHSARKPFLVVLVEPTHGPRLVKHLNDYIFLSHCHDPADGFPNTDEAEPFPAEPASRSASLSSVVRRNRATVACTQEGPPFTTQSITHLAALAKLTTLSTPILRHAHTLPITLRLHRAVHPSSITPQATAHLLLLTKYLAPLHGLDYATPSLVALAFRKVYRHRIRLLVGEKEWQKERSLQYGSEEGAVREYLAGVTAEEVLDDVLGGVEGPV
jgi:hypothetical protein